VFITKFVIVYSPVIFGCSQRPGGKDGNSLTLRGEAVGWPIVFGAGVSDGFRSMSLWQWYLGDEAQFSTRGKSGKAPRRGEEHFPLVPWRDTGHEAGEYVCLQCLGYD
jgi:hypothetical protein